MAINRQMVVQVTMPALLVALTMLGTSLLGIRSINRLQADRDKIVIEHGRSLQAAQDLETYLRRLRLHSFLYVMDMSPERWIKVQRDQDDFEKAFERVRQQEASPEKRQVIDAIDAGYVQYRAELQRSAHSPVGPEVVDYLRWADSHPIRLVVEPCDRLLEINRRETSVTAEESARQSDRTRSWMAVLAVIGAAGGLIGGFGVAWGISRSITRLSIRLQNVHAHLDSEVGSLQLSAGGGNLQRMERQVGAILERVHDVVGQLQRQERDGLRAEQLAAVGQLAAGIAHEVRNPLTSIKLLVGAALNGKCGRGLSEADLQVIHDEVGSLERKVQALLDFARPVEMTYQPVDVAEIVQRVIELVQERMRQQGVTVALSLPKLPLKADLDRDHFQSVLVNLVFNALDAMPKGGRIDVRLYEANRAIHLEVSDTGTGIDAGIADRLFTPFVSTKPTGTGLGLSLSRRVVEAHGGTLTVCNREGGACFTIQLPFAPREQFDADTTRRG